jgi:hypothetical protein
MTEAIMLGRDDYPGLTQTEKERLWAYQKVRADSGEKLCPYVRVGKRASKNCKIHGNRCWYGEDYLYCPKFQAWWSEAECGSLESLSPVG